MTDHADHPGLFNPMLGAEASAAESAFPSEVFSCPYCGQLLGAACRVCVACKRSINPADIGKSEQILETVEPQAPPAIAPARYSWPIFFTVLAISFVVSILLYLGFDENKSQLISWMLVTSSSAWVFFDAREKRVAKPLRWGLGSLLLWIVVFPWYLSRRRTPEAPCPFVEREATPLARVLLVALALFFLIGLVMVLVNGSPK